jgi:putative salt-induced outer membrane protein YdiY
LLLSTVASTFLVLVSTAPAVQDLNPAGPSAEIHANELALAAATHARDRRALEQLLAPGYVLRSAPDIDREMWIRNAISLCWGDRSTIDGFRARREDSVVIASFELTFYVDPASCRPAVMRSLITDVWTRHPGGWRLQIRHSSPAPSAAAGVAAQYGIAPQPPPAWDVTGELSLVATGGNASTRTAGLGSAMIHRTGAATTRASFAFVTSEADNVTQAESLTLEARHGVRVARQTELFARGSYARNRFAGIDDRVTTDGGVAVATPPLRRHTVTAEASLGFTAEQRLDGSDPRFVTATGGLGYVWKIVPGTELAEQIALVADLEAARNWRATSATRVTVALTRLLSLKASHAFEHRHTPVTGFGRSDTRTAVALVFSWQRPPAGR